MEKTRIKKQRKDWTPHKSLAGAKPKPQMTQRFQPQEIEVSGSKEFTMGRRIIQSLCHLKWGKTILESSVSSDLDLCKGYDHGVLGDCGEHIFSGSHSDLRQRSIHITDQEESRDQESVRVTMDRPWRGWAYPIGAGRERLAVVVSASTTSPSWDRRR